MTYSEKLKDPRWQKKRLEVFERDKWTCQWCGSKETTLHVHHECYEKGEEPWDTDEFLLTTLCADCHETNHIAKTPLEKYLLSCLRVRMMDLGEDLKLLNRVLKRGDYNG